MTRIERLELQGFKSFARKTIIEFPTNIVTICGPNGSGKSNILDAICFVLGRRSTKSLRAERTSELIFNGKKPAEYAKVSITFSNKNKEFPFEEESVVISKSVNRKGVSVFKINGKMVTREKVLEILRKVNISPDGHNIILQGDITNIIEMNDIERREIIDEISGIAEFDEKREKANKELLTVEERLKSSTIVLNERSTMMKLLEQQKEAADKYQEYTRELDKTRALLSKLRLIEAKNAMKRLQASIKEKEDANKEYDVGIEEIDRQLESIEKKISSSAERLIDRKADIELVSNIEHLKAEMGRKSDRIDFLKADNNRLSELKERLSSIQTVSPVIKEVLNLGWTGVYGSVGGLIKIPPKFKAAIEVAAGGHINDIVVKDVDTAMDCIKHLKDKKVGRATFLPLDKIQPRDSSHVKKYLNEPGVMGIALDLISYDKKYFNAMSFVFGDTLVVENIDIARKIGVGNARFVTLDGDLIEKSGAIIGGWYEHKKLFVSSEIERLEKQIEHNQAEIDNIQKELEILGQQLRELSKKQVVQTSELSDLQKQRHEYEHMAMEMRLKRKELVEKKINADNELQMLRIRAARLDAELENINAEFSNFKDIVPEDVDISTLEPLKLEHKIMELTNKIKSLGPVNMRAVEEWNALKKQYDDLSQKINTLIAERDKLFGIITDIESQRKEVFMRTLNEISNYFGSIFHDLSGYSGSLRLEYLDEAQTIDEAGLIIEAHHTAKGTVNLDSLSGGEKTLAALAFLFAIQQSRPTPFYVLDEIDAALDKPNTKKVVSLIKKYGSSAQFVVITHNDETISAGDCVYGVSMQEGESRLIGIKMPEK